MFFDTQRVEGGIKNQLKINPKMQSKMECTLASIIIRFWSVSVCKFGWKNDSKPMSKNIKNCDAFGKRPGPARK